ncbi:hypothetical protein SKAU_G00362660 [Synaphobranchus kaupii]|uniref:Metalloendopeptidase n=1 Tax=Synaphobranchus kaupii TaxID=118154 RepID=A0A9Q1IG90_SYNKA|nr:hypothetical protein SKAU_G00362660 [Synaphobranchus kaupii]
MGTSRASLFYFFFTVLINAPMDPAAKGNWIPDNNPETSFELMQYYIPATQGDVILWFDRNAVGSPWDVESIPYQISYQLAHREEVLTASLEEISQNTCVKFHPQTTELDYLFFTDGSGCASYLGKIGGKQPVYLSERCLKGNIVHELMHALGFHHEHMRQDRDDRITVLYENIIPEKIKNFDKIDGNILGLPYDTGSIMHYGEKFFSLNGNPTVVSKEGEPIGQRDGLSELDVKRVQLLYKCGEQTNTPAPVSAQSTTAPHLTTRHKVKHSHAPEWTKEHFPSKRNPFEMLVLFNLNMLLPRT